MMLSKNNRQLINRMNAKQRQRFGLRKLTVGVASVLLGTTFFLGGEVANADTVSATNNANTISATNQTTTSQTTVPTNHIPAGDNSQQSQQVTLTKTTSTVKEGQQSNNVLNENAVVTPVEANTAATNDTSVVSGLTFTGAVNGFQNTTRGKAATDTSFKAGDTAAITYQVQSSGAAQVGSSYLAMLPAGFKLATGNDAWKVANLAASDYHITALGQVGPNREYVYLIALDKTPYYGIPVFLTAKLQATGNSSTAGIHDYQGFPVPGLLMAINDNGLFKGSHTVTLGSQTYQVSDCSPFLHGNNIGTEIKYTMVPGNQQLNNHNYKVIAVNPSKVSRNGNQLSYEGIAPQIKLTGTVNDGDYIDFHLGIPYKDQQGQQKFLPYDSTLSPSFDVTEHGTVIGRVYNMGNYYRLVFNAAVQNFQNPTLQVNLKWAGNGDNPSINDNHYLYRKTDNVAQNDQEFTYQPTDDVNINGQQSASGFTVKGLYLSERPATDNVNNYSGSGITPSTVRTWDNEGHVGINTDWTEGFNFTVNTKQASNKFALDIRVAKNPQLHYYWETDASLADQIKNVLAPLTTHHLSNATVADSSIFVTDNPVRGEKPQVDVKVTHEDLNDTPNGYHRIYHVVIADPTVNMNYGFRVLTTAAPNFTMPAGITSYEEDKEQSVATNHEGTYNNSNPNQVTAALTGNTALNESFKAAHIPFGGGTAAAVMAVKNDTTNQEASEWGGAAWEADVVLKTNGTVEGGGFASYIVTSIVHIKDADTQAYLTRDGVMSQGATGSDIKFKGLQPVYDGLSDYQFVKAVSVKDGQEKAISQPDLTKLDSDIFGIANKNNPTEFIIYVRKANQQTATIKYIDDTTHKTLKTDNAHGTLGQDINFTVGPSQRISDYKDQNYVLVSNTFDDNKYQGDNTKNEFEVHFKHATEPASRTVKVNETINYVYAKDNSQAAPTYHAPKIEFHQTGTKDLVTNQTKWNSVASQTFASHRSPEVENYTPDESEIGPQTVTENSDNLNFTVTYSKNREPEKPNNPDHPVKPDHPVTPENPVKPDHPVTPENPSKPDHPVNPVQPDQPAMPEQPAGVNVTSESETHPQVHVTTSHPAATVKTSRQTMVNNQQSNHKVQLPQTGNQASRLSALGLLGLGFTALLGVISAKRKDE